MTHERWLRRFGPSAVREQLALLDRIEADTLRSFNECRRDGGEPALRVTETLATLLLKTAAPSIIEKQTPTSEDKTNE